MVYADNGRTGTVDLEGLPPRIHTYGALRQWKFIATTALKLLIFIANTVASTALMVILLALITSSMLVGHAILAAPVVVSLHSVWQYFLPDPVSFPILQSFFDYVRQSIIGALILGGVVGGILGLLSTIWTMVGITRLRMLITGHDRNFPEGSINLAIMTKKKLVFGVTMSCSAFQFAVAVGVSQLWNQVVLYDSIASDLQPWLVCSLFGNVFVAAALRRMDYTAERGQQEREPTTSNDSRRTIDCVHIGGSGAKAERIPGTFPAVSATITQRDSVHLYPDIVIVGDDV